MLLIQMSGLSGAGKTTLAKQAKNKLLALGYKVEIIDGDEYRHHLCRDLGFSKEDRMENIRRLGIVGLLFARQGIISIISAINPYEFTRAELATKSPLVKTVHVDCSIDTLKKRDVKGLYYRAQLPENHPDHVAHFTGISDSYETPVNPDLLIQTEHETIDESTDKFVDFLLSNICFEAPVQPALISATEPSALFIGRWQPFHNGHKWLIDQKLNQGIPVLIAVRDIPCDEKNPFTTAETVSMIQQIYAGQPVEVIIIPDIESVNYGRTVGYEVNCFNPPSDISMISATYIRNCILASDDSWKKHVDPSIHAMLNTLLLNQYAEHV